MTVATETIPFDVQDHLKTADDRAAYIAAALETTDPTFIALALSDVCEALGLDVIVRPAENPSSLRGA